MSAQAARVIDTAPRSFPTTLMIGTPECSQYYCGKCGRDVSTSQKNAMKCPYYSCDAFWNTIGIAYSAVAVETPRTHIYDLLRTHPYMVFIGFFDATDAGKGRVFALREQLRVTRASFGYVRYWFGQAAVRGCALMMRL